MQVIWNMFLKVYYGHSSPWMAGMSLLHMPQIAAARQWFQVSRKVRLVVCCVCISLCFWEACFIGGASNTCSWLSTNRCPLCRNHRNETYSMGRLTTRILFPHSAQDSQDILSISFGDSDSAKKFTGELWVVCCFWPFICLRFRPSIFFLAFHVFLTSISGISVIHMMYINFCR